MAVPEVVDLSRSARPPNTQARPSDTQATASYDAAAKAVTIDPFGCAPAIVPFAPADGFEFKAPGKAARWSRSHDGTFDALKENWPDFIHMDVFCASQRDAANRRAWNSWKIGIENQSEYPFAASGNPAVRELRQRFEVLTANLDALSPRLEYRTTFPDGAPPGFIYDQYEGYCWRRDPDTMVVIELAITVPLTREAEGRKWLEKGCTGLASAKLRRP